MFDGCPVILAFVSKITTDLQCRVILLPSAVLIQDFTDGKMLGILNNSHGLYVTQNHSHDDSSRFRHIAANIVVQSKPDALIWHQRFGHAFYSTLSRLPFLNWTLDCLKTCTICPMAKQSRLPFPDSDSQALKPFNLVHLEIVGTL